MQTGSGGAPGDSSHHHSSQHHHNQQQHNHQQQQQALPHPEAMQVTATSNGPTLQQQQQYSQQQQQQHQQQYSQQLQQPPQQQQQQQQQQPQYTQPQMTITPPFAFPQAPGGATNAAALQGLAHLFPLAVTAAHQGAPTTTSNVSEPSSSHAYTPTPAAPGTATTATMPGASSIPGLAGNPAFAALASNPQQQQLLWQQALQAFAGAGLTVPDTTTQQQQQQQAQHFLQAAAAAAAAQQQQHQVAAGGNTPLPALQSFLHAPPSIQQQQQQHQQQQQQQQQPTLLPTSAQPLAAPTPGALMSTSAAAALSQQPQQQQLPLKRPAPGSDAGEKKAAKTSKDTMTAPSASTGDSSSSVPTAATSDDFMFDPRQKEVTAAEWEKMTPAEKRRHERNLREQQRSYRISQQIKQLRDVLNESNIPFKPNKFSILVSVVDYIKQLQGRAIMLDTEHQKLVDTIRQTTEAVNSGAVLTNSEDDYTVGAAAGASAASKDAATSGGGGDASAADMSDMLFVQDIDYRQVFGDCPYAMGVASLDGRILGCNRSFEDLLDCDRDELVQQSLFVHIRNHQEIFEAMADLLKRSTAATETGEGTVKKAEQLLYWRGNIVSTQNEKFSCNITLTSLADGNPKYFSLSVSR